MNVCAAFCVIVSFKVQTIPLENIQLANAFSNAFNVQCLIKYDEELSLSNWKMAFLFATLPIVINALSHSKVPMNLQNQMIHIFTFVIAHEYHEGFETVVAVGFPFHRVLSEHQWNESFWQFTIQTSLKGSSHLILQRISDCLFVSAINTAISNIHVCKWKHYTYLIFIHSYESNYCENISLWMVLPFSFSFTFQHPATKSFELQHSTFIFVQPFRNGIVFGW